MSRPHLITDAYDYGGKRYQRASQQDIESLARRVAQTVQGTPGFEGNSELIGYVTQAITLYDRGDYRATYTYLSACVDRLPALKPHLFYYLRVCERVLAVPPTLEEVQYEAEVRRYLGRPKWLRKLTKLPHLYNRTLSLYRDTHLKVRCKWCGRYTSYIDPHTSTCGFDTLANSCEACGRMYPMPSWLWDSPDGRAYSYYRRSFLDGEFYKEFERDYNPTRRRRRSAAT